MNRILGMKKRLGQAERGEQRAKPRVLVGIARLDRQHVRAVVQQRTAARMQIDQIVRSGEQRMFDVIRNHLGWRAGRIAWESPVQVAAVER